MARIVAGLASSHAYTFADPQQWDERRATTRGRFAQRYGRELPEQPGVAQETLEDNQRRYRRIRDGLEHLRARLQELQPDVWILIGDDQDENYRVDNLPQFAIYVGEEFVAAGRGSASGSRYRCDSQLARGILDEAVEDGFDLASSASFPNEALISHAHHEVLRFMDPEGRVPVVPIFINAIHVPAPTPARCYALGQTLRRAIESHPGDKRVVLYASGGWSHFTAGYPWPHYQGPHTLGAICTDFDRHNLEMISEGRGAELAALSSRDLRDNGGIEMRQWIVLLGALGDRKPELVAYEPFYRAVMGMAVADWDLEASPAAAPAAAGSARA